MKLLFYDKNSYVFGYNGDVFKKLVEYWISLVTDFDGDLIKKPYRVDFYYLSTL